MSFPRTFSTQAISSREVRRMASQEFLRRNFLSIVILSERDWPVMSSPRVMIGVSGIDGRSLQKLSMKSGASTILKESSSSSASRQSFLPEDTKAEAMCFTELTVWDSPSTATVILLFSEGNAYSASHWGIGICSGTLILWSSIPVPGRSFPACMKYLVSVQRPA